MKLEVGKSYRSRDGFKAVVESKNPHRGFDGTSYKPGPYNDPDTGLTPYWCWWKDDGTANNPRNDLVALWGEPPPLPKTVKKFKPMKWILSGDSCPLIYSVKSGVIDHTAKGKIRRFRVKLFYSRIGDWFRRGKKACSLTDNGNEYAIKWTDGKLVVLDYMEAEQLRMLFLEADRIDKRKPLEILERK